MGNTGSNGCCAGIFGRRRNRNFGRPDKDQERLIKRGRKRYGDIKSAFDSDDEYFDGETCNNCCGDYLADFCGPKKRKGKDDDNGCCGDMCKRKEKDNPDAECCSGDNNNDGCCGGRKKAIDRFKKPPAAMASSATDSAEKPLRVSIAYWKFRGLGAPMRMMCVYAGVPHDEEQFEVRKDEHGWKCPEYDAKKKELARLNPIAQLPYVQNHTTGEVICGINALYLYLGRILKLDGKTPYAKLKNEQVLFYLLGTMWLEYGDFVYPFKKNDDEAVFRAGLDDYLTKSIPTHYEKLQSWLKGNRDDFFAGQDLTTCDFHVWEFMDQHEALARKFNKTSPLRGYEHLEAFYENVWNHSKLSRYWDSQNYQLPINNKMAFF